MECATRLGALYRAECRRLAAFAETDVPQGEYANPVFGEGSPASHVVFLGEAPGAEETKAARPFVGKAGKQLDELLALAAIPRSAVYITNAVKYRPVIRNGSRNRNRTPGREELADALPLLQEELYTIRPKIVVTLGNTPLCAMLALFRQERTTVGAVHGAALPLEWKGMETVLFPLYHPASGIYNPALIAVMRQDIAALARFLSDQKLVVDISD